MNPTASEWMPRFGSVSEDRKCKDRQYKDRQNRDHNNFIFLVSDNGLDFEDPIPLETVSAELILPTEEESEG